MHAAEAQAGLAHRRKDYGVTTYPFFKSSKISSNVSCLNHTDTGENITTGKRNT